MTTGQLLETNAPVSAVRITFALEPWARYYPECLPLWREHYAEFEPFHRGRLPFGPDVAMYEEADRLGRLQILVARSAGVMIGYCLCMVRRHPHYAVICAFEDSYYLAPAWRRGMAGVRLIRRSKEALRARGVSGPIYFMTKEFNSVARLFAWLGLERCDSVWVWW